MKWVETESDKEQLKLGEVKWGIQLSNPGSYRRISRNIRQRGSWKGKSKSSGIGHSEDSIERRLYQAH